MRRDCQGAPRGELLEIWGDFMPRATRSRLWAVKLSYYYYVHDAQGNIKNNVTIDQWKEIVREIIRGLIAKGLVDWAVLVWHDLDGSGSDPIHVHFVMHLVDAKEQSVVMGWTGCTRDMDCEIVHNLARKIRYLLHVTERALNNPDKAIYDYSKMDDFVAPGVKFDRRALFIEKAKKSKNTKDIEKWHMMVATGKATLDDIRAEYLGQADLGLTRWNKDLSSYKTDQQTWMLTLNKYYQTHNGCKTVIYIRGAGGSSKTDLAQMIIGPYYADKHGVHVPAAPMRRVTYDPIGTYSGQRVSVLNEIKGSAWMLEGFCECLDPTHAGMTGSRYFDRPYFPDIVCMTTSDTLETFISDMFLRWINHGEKKPYELQYVLPYGAPARVPELQQRTTSQYDYGGSIEYSDDAGSIWDKVWQVRRRVPIVVTLENGMAHIELLDYSKRTCVIFPSNYGDPRTRPDWPYISYCTVPYSTTDPAIIKAFLEALNNAILWYYYFNKFTITPETNPRPDIILEPPKGKKVKGDDDDDDE